MHMQQAQTWTQVKAEARERHQVSYRIMLHLIPLRKLPLNLQLGWEQASPTAPPGCVSKSL